MGTLRRIVGIGIMAPVFGVLGLLAVIVGNLLRLLHLPKAADAAVHGILWVLIRWIFFSLGAIVRVEGRDNIPAKGERICYVPNHSSMVDIPVLPALPADRQVKPPGERQDDLQGR